MKNTKEKIMKASIKLFEEKGYIETTTLEIADKAGVAEVTLFRNFQTKLILFQETIQYFLSIEMDDDKIEEMIQLPSQEFYFHLMKNRIEVAKKNKKLLRLIIKESFSDHLPKSFRFKEMIFNHIKKVIKRHMEYYHLDGHPDTNARIIAGILLSTVIIPGEDILSTEELTKKYLKIL
jgi:AcrR family transcriptional regulator